MKLNILLIFLMADLVNLSSTVNNLTQLQTSEKVLSRRKRYLIFPTGASFSVAVCMTIGVYGNPQFSFASFGLNWGFAYELPSNVSYLKFDPTVNKEKRSVESKPMTDRRHRKDLYNRLEVIMGR